jgi:hypothetical protein
MVMKKRRRGIVLLVVAAALMVASATFAQVETRGKITGRVTDTTKGIIPGATVTVTDVARNATQTSTTNEQGLFQFNYLLPGSYSVKVELVGFKTQIQENVALQITETRNLAFVLEVGTIQEAVSVTAEALTVNTSDANMGLIVDQQRLASLPLIHGDPYKIMGLATGLTFQGDPKLDRPFEPSHITNFAYNGTRGLRSDLLIDGLPSTATANANEVIATYVPPSDLVQEFKVQTATFDAQFGNTEGGVTSMAIRSGTNRFKGTGYYYAEPSALGANDYFGELRGEPKIKSNSNRPGFTIGGPVIIPKLLNGKDKTFFMFGYEMISDKRPRFGAAATSWVPTEALRNGDFSAYSSKILIFDPLTRTGTSTYTGTAFPGNVIPPNRISPIAKAILGYYCLPKNSGTNAATGPAGNITDSNLPETTKYYNTITARVDQKVTTNNRMFGRFSWYSRNSQYNDYLGSLASGTWFHFGSWQGVVDDVHVFNPTTVLNVRVGYNRFDRNADMQYEEARGFDLTQLGFPSQYNSLVSTDLRRFPRLDFTSGDMISVAYGNDFRPITTKTIAATLNKSMGAHSLKGGVEIRQYNERSLPTGNAQSGQYTLNNTYTRQSSASGTDYQGLQAYAAFLLGMPGTTAWQTIATYDEYSLTSGFFVQDDWRLSEKLTLNLGLRWEVERALVERDDKSVSGFDYTYTQPIEATAQARYAALNDPALKALVPQLSVKGGLKYAGVDGGSGLYNTPKDTFLPRVGFAYRLTSKTVIRGGAGLFAGFLGQRRGDVITTGWSQTTTAPVSYNAYGAPIGANMANAFLTTPLLQPVGNANGRQTSLGQGISFFNQDPAVSKQLRYQIGFQRELPGGMTFEAAYVGNYGYDIEIFRNINALPLQYLNTDNSRTAAMNANNTWLTGVVTNPFAGLLPGSSYNNATIARSQLLRPYPEFGDITTTVNDGKTWYSAGQFSLQKRFSKGYTIGVAYTLSKWEQATEYLNQADANPTRMIGDFDSTHRLSISGIYELPFGKGRRFMSNTSGLVDGLIGGWQVQGVYTYQTGYPVQFGTFNLASGATSGDLFYNGGTIAVSDPSLSKWFNTDVFKSILTDSVSNNSTPVNHVRTFPYRVTEVRRDAINSMDLSFIKNTRLPGNKQLQLRLEYINFLNNPYFADPVVSATSVSFGQIPTSTAAASNYARRAQVGVKLLF